MTGYVQARQNLRNAIQAAGMKGSSLEGAIYKALQATAEHERQEADRRWQELARKEGWG